MDSSRSAWSSAPLSAGDRRAAPGVSDLAFAALGAFCFGLTVLFSRGVARDGLPPSTALGIRFGVAGALLLVVLAALRRPLLPPPGERLRAYGLGLCLYAVESTFFYAALQRGTAAAVTLIFYAYPAVVALAEVALGAVRLRPPLVVALVLSIGGGATVAAGGGRVVISATGVLLVCGSIVAFSCYVLASARALSRTDSLTAAAWTAIGASTGILLTGVVAGTHERPSAGALGAVTANGVATAAAFTLFFVVLGRLGPTRTAIVMALEAVTGVALAAVFLDESVRPLVALGGVAILSGAVVAAMMTPAHVEQLESASPA
ncbi:MAG TPA: DMT family transporter [Acidimicrobiia bacterium]|nr:DMT family transporter [Acidimicrobiia bacterium]